MAKQHQHRHATLDSALEGLKRANLKRTKSREVLLEYLVNHHGPFSVKELQAALKRKDLDAVTTYRCLDAFEEAGLVRRCDFGDGVSRFEIQGDCDHHHHHVICTSCRKIENLGDCHLAGLETKVKELGYSGVRHILEFTGLCRGCAGT